MIDGVTLPGTFALPAKHLQPAYLGERVALSPDDGSSGVIGTLSSFKMAALPPIANAQDSFVVTVRVGGVKYELAPDQLVHVMDLFEVQPLP